MTPTDRRAASRSTREACLGLNVVTAAFFATTLLLVALQAPRELTLVMGVSALLLHVLGTVAVFIFTGWKGED